MCGTSHIRIGEVASMGREITVRNVVLGELRLARRARPTRLGGTPHPTEGPRQARSELQHLVDDGNGYVRANVTHMIPVLILHIKMLVL